MAPAVTLQLSFETFTFQIATFHTYIHKRFIKMMT